MIVFFFVNDTATTELYTYGHTLSLHDALPIYAVFVDAAQVAVYRPVGDGIVRRCQPVVEDRVPAADLRLHLARRVAHTGVEIVGRLRVRMRGIGARREEEDRKSTRLNSSH